MARIFGHGCQAASQLADHFVLVAVQLIDVNAGRAKINAERGHVADFVHHGGDMQQRFGRDAAHFQADAAERCLAFDQYHLLVQVGRAESSRIAAGAGTEYQHVEVQGRFAETGWRRSLNLVGRSSCYIFRSNLRRSGLRRSPFWCFNWRWSRRTGGFERHDDRAVINHVAELDPEFLDHAASRRRDFHQRQP